MPNTYGLIIGEQDRGNAHYFTVSQSEKLSTWYYMQMHKYKLIKQMPVWVNTFQKEDSTGTKFLVKFWMSICISTSMTSFWVIFQSRNFGRVGCWNLCK